MKGLEVCKSTSLWKLHLEADFHTHLPKKAAQYRLSCGSGVGNKDTLQSTCTGWYIAPYPHYTPSLQITYATPDNIFSLAIWIWLHREL